VTIPFYINLLLGVLVLINFNKVLGILILIKILGEYITSYRRNISIYFEYKEYMYDNICGLFEYVYLFLFTYKKDIFKIFCIFYIMDFNFILDCLNGCIYEVYMELASVKFGYLFLFGFIFCLSFMYFSYKYSLWIFYPRVSLVTNIICIIFIALIIIYNLYTILNLIKIISYYIPKMMTGKATSSSAQDSAGNSGGNPREGSGGNPGGGPGENPGGSPGGYSGEGSGKKKRKPKARWHEKYEITRKIIKEKEEKKRLKEEELKKIQKEKKEEKIRNNLEKKRIEDEKLKKKFSYGNVEPAKPTIPTMYDPITGNTRVIYSTDGSRAPLPDQTIPGPRVVPRPSTQQTSTDASNQSGPGTVPINYFGFRPFSPLIRNAEEQAAHDTALALLALSTVVDHEEEEDIYNA
jgi:hypothetical protein